jgi:hypothetical protein
LNARGVDQLDQPALMKLLPVREHIERKRYPDRATGIARYIDQG